MPWGRRLSHCTYTHAHALETYMYIYISRMQPQTRNRARLATPYLRATSNHWTMMMMIEMCMHLFVCVRVMCWAQNSRRARQRKPEHRPRSYIRVYMDSIHAMATSLEHFWTAWTNGSNSSSSNNNITNNNYYEHKREEHWAGFKGCSAHSKSSHRIQ